MTTDNKLKDALIAQLNFWLGRSADNVHVTVADGIATLRGCVPSYEEKINAVAMVRRTGGVTEVLDEIVVELPEIRQRTDAEIAASAVDMIHWLTTVPPGSIKITVQAGRVILEGTVNNWSQKHAVEYATRPLPGITGITNSITIKSQSLQRDVKAAIESSFKKHAWPDAGKIEVEAAGTIGDIPYHP